MGLTENLVDHSNSLNPSGPQALVQSEVRWSWQFLWMGGSRFQCHRPSSSGVKCPSDIYHIFCKKELFGALSLVASTLQDNGEKEFLIIEYHSLKS